MSYKLIYTSRARKDLIAATDYIAQNAPETAKRWFDGFVDKIATLATNPHIYGSAPENSSVEADIRQIIYRSDSGKANQALFIIKDQKVFILCIRRPGQQLLTKSEIQKRLNEAPKS